MQPKRCPRARLHAGGRVGRPREGVARAGRGGRPHTRCSELHLQDLGPQLFLQSRTRTRRKHGRACPPGRGSHVHSTSTAAAGWVLPPSTGRAARRREHERANPPNLASASRRSRGGQLTGRLRAMAAGFNAEGSRTSAGAQGALLFSLRHSTRAPGLVPARPRNAARSRQERRPGPEASQGRTLLRRTRERPPRRAGRSPQRRPAWS